MKNARSTHKGGRKPGNALPCGAILLTAAPKRSSPEIDHVLTKRIEAIGIGWYHVIYRLVSYRLALIPLLRRVGAASTSCGSGKENRPARGLGSAELRYAGSVCRAFIDQAVHGLQQRGVFGFSVATASLQSVAQSLVEVRLRDSQHLGNPPQGVSPSDNDDVSFSLAIFSASRRQPSTHLPAAGDAERRRGLTGFL